MEATQHVVWGSSGLSARRGWMGRVTLLDLTAVADDCVVSVIVIQIFVCDVVI